MSKQINEQATNKINIIGKLLDVSTATGKLSDGREYERASLTIRVTQTYNNLEETSEIPVSMFASKYTLTNKPNPAYDNIQKLKTMKTVQGYGEAEAETIRISGATLRENNFVARSGQLISGWQLNASFINSAGNMSDIASFSVDVYIMDMHDEVDSDGEETGRLIIKGGVVQYNGALDVLEFIVEGADRVEYVKRTYDIDQTVNLGGRIRITSSEEPRSTSGGSWGEELPEMTTRLKRELIVTRGSEEPFDEEFAYDPSDIKKAFNIRKANIEQMQVAAKSNSQKTSAASTAAPTKNKYSWE